MKEFAITVFICMALLGFGAIAAFLFMKTLDALRRKRGWDACGLWIMFMVMVSFVLFLIYTLIDEP